MAPAASTLIRHGEARYRPIGIDALPSCVYVQDANPKAMNEVGPAVPWLRAVTVVMVFTQGLIYVAVRSSSKCTDEGGYAVYPRWIWLVAVPNLILRNCVEWYACKLFLGSYVNIAMAQQLAPFKVMGLEVPFCVWVLFYVIVSNLNYADVLTDSIFAAVIAKGTSCDRDKLHSVWASAWEQSPLGHAGIPPWNISDVIFCVWCLSFFQLYLPLITTITTNEGPRLYERGDMGKGESCFGVALYNDDKCMQLAEASGMATLQSLSITAYHAEVEDNHGAAALEYAVTLCGQIVKRIALTYILENCLQISLQASFFAVNRAITHGRMGTPEKQALLSVGLSVGLTLFKLTDFLAFRDFIHMAEHYVPQSFDDHSYKCYRFYVKASIFFGIFMVISLFYSVVKLGGAFICKDAMMNMNGCAHLADVHINSDFLSGTPFMNTTGR